MTGAKKSMHAFWAISIKMPAFCRVKGWPNFKDLVKGSIRTPMMIKVRANAIQMDLGTAGDKNLLASF